MEDATVAVRNPRTGQTDYRFPRWFAEDLLGITNGLRQGQQTWRQGGVAERVAVMQAWKVAVTTHEEQLINALTADTGRYHESVLEARLVASSIDRWCDIASELFSSQTEKTASIPFIEIQPDLVPYELVGVISPWNFPLLLSLIDSIPALLAGCAVVVKPSEITPRFAEVMMETIQEVPALAEVFAYVQGDGAVGADLLQQIDLVCFTGSVATGRKIYHAAAENFIPAFLELGGKDPAIVLEGADLAAASSSLLWASTANCGHSCLSIERIYVQESIFESFVEQLVEKAKQLKLAHPEPADGQIGPVIAERQAEIINDHLSDALAKGAKLRYGSEACVEKDGGMWCLPTVLTNVNHRMKVMTEETFGPIMPIMAVKDEADAIAKANDTQFGLSAAVFAADWETARKVGAQIEAGAISINDAGLTAIVHEGEKNAFGFSGIGATRMGPAAIKRFMRQRAFLVKKQPITSPWWHQTSG